MIQVYRFMSNTEKDFLSNGKTIVNHTDHSQLRGDNATTSKGFCFGIGNKQEAILTSRFLKGIVTMQWLMVAEVDEKDTIFHVGTGRYITGYDNYAQPKSYGYFKELYTEEMNIDDFEDVHFYPVFGLLSIPSKSRGYITAIVPPQRATNREREGLLRCNRRAHEIENSYSYFVTNPKITMDFTRKSVKELISRLK